MTILTNPNSTLFPIIILLYHGTLFLLWWTRLQDTEQWTCLGPSILSFVEKFSSFGVSFIGGFTIHNIKTSEINLFFLPCEGQMMTTVHHDAHTHTLD